MKNDILSAVENHGVMSHALGFASMTAASMASSALLNGRFNEKPVIGDAATGATAGVFNQTLQSGVNSALSKSLMVPRLAIAGPEMLSLASSAMVAGAIDRSLSNKVSEDMSTLISDTAGGVTFAVTTDAVVAGAGLASALMTGTELGAAFGAVGGPLGIILGAAGGLAIGAGSIALHHLVKWWKRH
eukprot:4617025-Pleurochrysis_carterae.AAC.1